MGKNGQTIYRVELVKSESVVKNMRALTGAEIRAQYKDGVKIDGVHYTVKSVVATNFKVSRRIIPAQEWDSPAEVKLSDAILSEIEADFSALVKEKKGDADEVEPEE